MATVNLGAIKFNWKGAYNNSTQYQVDDVVSSGGSSYVCILASQGNAVSNGTYWNLMAEAGTDGTDVGATLTTQGDILYRDASGLQRLAKGTAGQVLRMNSGATAPEYGTVSSDFVQIYSAVDVSPAGYIDINGYFNDAYKVYKIYFEDYGSVGGNSFLVQFNSGTNGATNESSSNYFYNYRYGSVEAGNSTQRGDNSAGNSGNARLGWNGGGNSTEKNSTEFTLYNPNSAEYTSMFAERIAWDNSYVGFTVANVTYKQTTAITGIRLYHGSGNIGLKWIKVYGLK